MIALLKKYSFIKIFRNKKIEHKPNYFAAINLKLSYNYHLGRTNSFSYLISSNHTIVNSGKPLNGTFAHYWLFIF
jgi:hypothetical protein